MYWSGAIDGVSEVALVVGGFNVLGFNVLEFKVTGFNAPSAVLCEKPYKGEWNGVRRAILCEISYKSE